MELADDIKLYLPQYLSEADLVSLKQQLRSFAKGYDIGQYFTDRLKCEPYLFQGDGVKALMCNLPNPQIEEAPVLLLSNTCDMDIGNERINPCRIMYAPILNLEKYIKALQARGHEQAAIDNHVKDIKSQVVSQILYLPTSAFWDHDSIVFFDRAISIPLSRDSINKCIQTRSFTLSNYGFYLLLLKLSYHFTRIQEKVDRSV